MRPTDTTAEAWDIVQAGLAAMTPAQRIRRSIDLTIFAHGLALARIRERWPHEDERRWRLRLAKRLLPANLMHAAFGSSDDGS